MWQAKYHQRQCVIHVQSAVFSSVGTMRRLSVTADQNAFMRGDDMKPRITWQRWLQKWVCQCNKEMAYGSTPSEAFRVWKKLHRWRDERMADWGK